MSTANVTTDAANVPSEIHFKPDIFQPLVDALPSLVESLNFREGALGDAAQSELVIQREIAMFLKARLPCASLVRQNQVLIRDGGGACLPDLIIDRIGGGCWAAIELKLQLAGDRLSLANIKRDVDKLCRYKARHPGAHCVFLVVGGGRAMQVGNGVSPEAKRALASGAGVSIALHQRIKEALQDDGSYKAVLSADGKYHTATRAVAWEIVGASEAPFHVASRYHFFARMQS